MNDAALAFAAQEEILRELVEYLDGSAYYESLHPKIIKFAKERGFEIPLSYPSSNN